MGALKRVAIRCLLFETIPQMTMSFLRFQEHYESPEFRGRIFTLEEFKEWYTRTTGAFTYPTDWGGFNVPDHAFAPFLAGKFDPLTDGEERILAQVRGLTPPYYIVGARRRDSITLCHEVIHGLYYLYPVYRTVVDRIIARHDLSGFKQHLIALGYDQSVLNDEINAYLVSDYDLKVVFMETRAVKRELQQHFYNLFGWRPWKWYGRSAMLRCCTMVRMGNF